jgi:hypothetical protein
VEAGAFSSFFGEPDIRKAPVAKRVLQAHDLLMPVYARFTEGFGTADLVAARTLLQQLAA